LKTKKSVIHLSTVHSLKARGKVSRQQHIAHIFKPLNCFSPCWAARVVDRPTGRWRPRACDGAALLFPGEVRTTTNRRVASTVILPKRLR
ncbi:AGAP000944-PA, partial [Anopheles gambiae str. PEST]